jgi:hypothetical protein
VRKYDKRLHGAARAAVTVSPPGPPEKETREPVRV